MAKFSGARAAPNRLAAPITTTKVLTPTYEGGLGYVRDAKSELFLLACTNMVSEHTFYEDARSRDARFTSLIAQVVVEDADWLARFIPYLRSTMLMRSASVVAAAEYVANGGPNARKVVAGALARGDEPAEILAYWFQTRGRKIPAALKRGVADAVVRLYTPNAVLKYDGKARGWRMGDVLELVHPKSKDAEQSALFKHLLDQRHHGDSEFKIEGTTWERANPTTAAEWEALIPSMGYMALLRNLNNFDKVGISDEAAQSVISRLTDSEQVARSRQFPIRFFSAWKATQSMRWGPALKTALDLATANIPSLPGRTLVLVDVSDSMRTGMSARSQVGRWEVASVFGLALAKACADADLYAYSIDHAHVPVSKSHSVLRNVESLWRWPGAGSGTQTWATFAATYSGQDRVVIITDEQTMGQAPADVRVPIYVFNVAGYAPASMESGANRYTFGGLTDAGFQLLSILESRKDGSWPF